MQTQPNDQVPAEELAALLDAALDGSPLRRAVEEAARTALDAAYRQGCRDMFKSLVGASGRGGRGGERPCGAVRPAPEEEVSRDAD